MFLRSAARGIERNVRMKYICAALFVLTAVSAQAETAFVKYRGPVALAPFACEQVSRSSFIYRVCYDVKNKYMLINLNGTWYHYCEIPQLVVTALLSADSMGRYYNANIKSQYDCRVHHMPEQ